MNTIDLSLLILQLGVGLTFAAHGAQKVFGWWGGPGLAGWEGAMRHMGFRPARLFALVSANVELVGGLLLAAGILTPLVAAVLLAQTVVIIGQVHWANGFFNTKSGIEFPLLLGVGAAAVGLGGPSAVSVDAALGALGRSGRERPAAHCGHRRRLRRPRDPAGGGAPGCPSSRARVGCVLRMQEREMTDDTIVARINGLAHEEERLWERAADGGGLSTDDQDRLATIKVELDQCYDLLHQRQARREAGLDPAGAHVRSADVVENYRQ